MLNKLNFQNKTYLTYSVFVILVFIILELIFYIYISNVLIENSTKTLEQTRDRISSNLDSLIKEMDTVSTQVFFNSEIQTILSFAKEDDNKGFNYFDLNLENMKKVRNILLSINSPKINTSRIGVFTGSSNSISIGIKGDDPGEFERNFNKENLEQLLKQIPDKGIVLSPHKDYWLNEKNSEIVISIIRKIKSTLIGGYYDLGYVEVQKPYLVLDEICKTSDDSSIKVLVFDENGDTIYPFGKIPLEEAKYYLSLGNVSNTVSKNPINGLEELVCSSKSSRTNWKIVLTQSKIDFLSPLHFVQNVLFISALFLLIVTLFIMYVITFNLTAPIREIRKLLKGLSMDNLSININNNTNNEVILLNEAFNKTLGRLKESMEQTIEAKSSESQAHFLALQSQMNPHFIYNTLMVISSAGFELGSEKIVMICSQFSEMMRYIAAPDTMKITLGDELTHVKNYLELLKWRFEDLLTYDFNVDERLYSVHVPKLILQPLVENSYNHGFSDKRPPWNLKIDVKSEMNKWVVEISDNGNGFSEVNLTNIKEKIANYKKQLALSKTIRGLNIGGMGLSNIYYRLHMLYSDELIFEINGNSEGGATIKIGGPITGK